MNDSRRVVVTIAALAIACISFFSFFSIYRARDLNREQMPHFYEDDEEKDNDKEFELVSNIYNVGYVDNIRNRNIVVSNRKDLENYMNNFLNKSEILDKYNEDYFEDGSLALVYETTGNSAITIKVNNLEIIGNSVKIDYSRESSSEIGATVMGGYLIVVEVPKSVTSISN